MSTFEIVLNDRSTHVISDADAYQQEGVMTTFFRTGDDRGVIDAWSSRVASIRTGEIMLIQRTDDLSVNDRCRDAAAAESGGFKVVV